MFLRYDEPLLVCRQLFEISTHPMSIQAHWSAHSNSRSKLLLHIQYNLDQCKAAQAMHKSHATNIHCNQKSALQKSCTLRHIARSDIQHFWTPIKIKRYIVCGPVGGGEGTLGQKFEIIENEENYFFVISLSKYIKTRVLKGHILFLASCLLRTSCPKLDSWLIWFSLFSFSNNFE